MPCCAVPCCPGHGGEVFACLGNEDAVLCWSAACTSRGACARWRLSERATLTRKRRIADTTLTGFRSDAFSAVRVAAGSTATLNHVTFRNISSNTPGPLMSLAAPTESLPQDAHKGSAAAAWFHECSFDEAFTLNMRLVVVDDARCLVFSSKDDGSESLLPWVWNTEESASKEPIQVLLPPAATPVDGTPFPATQRDGQEFLTPEDDRFDQLRRGSVANRTGAAAPISPLPAADSRIAQDPNIGGDSAGGGSLETPGLVAAGAVVLLLVIAAAAAYFLRGRRQRRRRRVRHPHRTHRTSVAASRLHDVLAGRTHAVVTPLWSPWILGRGGRSGSVKHSSRMVQVKAGAAAAPTQSAGTQPSSASSVHGPHQSGADATAHPPGSGGEAPILDSPRNPSVTQHSAAGNAFAAEEQRTTPAWGAPVDTRAVYLPQEPTPSLDSLARRLQPMPRTVFTILHPEPKEPESPPRAEAQAAASSTQQAGHAQRAADSAAAAQRTRASTEVSLVTLRPDAGLEGHRHGAGASATGVRTEAIGGGAAVPPGPHAVSERCPEIYSAPVPAVGPAGVSGFRAGHGSDTGVRVIEDRGGQKSAVSSKGGTWAQEDTAAATPAGVAAAAPPGPKADTDDAATSARDQSGTGADPALSRRVLAAIGVPEAPPPGSRAAAPPGMPWSDASTGDGLIYRGPLAAGSLPGGLSRQGAAEAQAPSHASDITAHLTLTPAAATPPPDAQPPALLRGGPVSAAAPTPRTQPKAAAAPTPAELMSARTSRSSPAELAIQSSATTRASDLTAWPGTATEPVQQLMPPSVHREPRMLAAVAAGTAAAFDIQRNKLHSAPAPRDLPDAGSSVCAAYKDTLGQPLLPPPPIMSMALLTHRSAPPQSRSTISGLALPPPSRPSNTPLPAAAGAAAATRPAAHAATTPASIAPSSFDTAPLSDQPPPPPDAPLPARRQYVEYQLDTLVALHTEILDGLVLQPGMSARIVGGAHTCMGGMRKERGAHHLGRRRCWALVGVVCAASRECCSSCTATYAGYA